MTERPLVNPRTLVFSYMELCASCRSILDERQEPEVSSIRVSSAHPCQSQLSPALLALLSRMKQPLAREGDMGVDKTKKKNSATDKAMDFIMVIVSSTAAPLLSHALETLSPYNTWDTDRLVILYFASLSGYIIANKVRRLAESSSKLSFLDYSDVVHELIWFLPVVVVAFCYENPLALLFLACCFVISFAVLRRDWDKIQIDYPKLILIAIVTVIIIWIGFFSRFDSEGEMIFPELLLFLGILVVTSYFFDKAEKAIRKRRELATKAKESK